MDCRGIGVEDAPLLTPMPSPQAGRGRTGAAVSEKVKRNRRRPRAGAEVRRRWPCHLRRHRRQQRRAVDGRAHERRGAQAHRRDRRGLVFLALAQGALEEGRKLRPHPARRRDAGRLRPGRGLDQGRAAGRRAPATPGGGPASTGWCRSGRPARSRSNSATPTRRSTRTRSTTRSSDQRAFDKFLARASNCRARSRCGRSYITPPMPTVPAPGLSANAAITASARLIASAVGVNTSLIAGDLRRMDRHLAGEAVAAGLLAFAPQPGFVAKIDIDRVDRLHLGGGGAGEAEAPRQLIGRQEMSVAVAVGLGAELDRKILRAPGQAFQPLARAAIGAGEEHRLRGFGGDGDDVERAVGQAVDRLARGDLGVAMDHRRAAFGLREHDAVGTAGHHGVEVVVGQAGGEPVDAHVDARALFRPAWPLSKRRAWSRAPRPCSAARSNPRGRAAARRRRCPCPCRVSSGCRRE